MQRVLMIIVIRTRIKLELLPRAIVDGLGARINIAPHITQERLLGHHTPHAQSVSIPFEQHSSQRDACTQGTRDM